MISFKIRIFCHVTLQTQTTVLPVFYEYTFLVCFVSPKAEVIYPPSFCELIVVFNIVSSH